jgi:dolichol kinase
LLRDLDPSRYREDLEARVRGRIAEMSDKFRRISERAASNEADDLPSTLAHVADVLTSDVPEPALPAEKLAEAWTAYRKRLGDAYESLSQRLRARQVELPSLRPTNYTRSLVHVGCGVSSLLLIEYVFDDRMRAVIPVSFALFFWFLETLRRFSATANRFLMWVFRTIAHPREAHHVNSSTWYGTSLAVLGLLFPLPVCAVAVATVAFADPSASLVGRRWGRTKLVGQRSLEGTATFALVATLVGFGALMVWHRAAIAPGRALLVAAVAGVGSAMAELFSGKLDDNLSVPLSSAALAWATLQLV